MTSDAPADFEQLRREIIAVLPNDVSRPEAIADYCARHLVLVLDVNRRMNLTRITDPHEAAIKHVYDSLAVRHLIEPFETIVDMGSGAGFPGIPLAALFPDKQIILAESVKKKARFLSEAVVQLGLPSVEVRDERVEDVLASQRADAVVARAVGVAGKVLHVLSPVLDRFDELLLFKGRRADAEIEETRERADSLGMTADVPLRYELPEALGSHCIVRYTRDE